MSFVYGTNQTPASHPAAVLLLKATLKDAGWTIPLSSDGFENVGPGDCLTKATSGPNGLGNARAWFVARQPPASGPWAGLRELCFQGDGRFGWRIKYARREFVGTVLERSPQAPGERFVLGGSSDEDPHFDPWFPPHAEGSYRYNIVAQAVSPFGFWAGGYAEGAEPGAGVFLLDPMLLGSFPFEDPDPVVLYVTGSTHAFAAEHLGGSEGPQTFSQEALVRAPALVWATARGQRLAPGGLFANVFTGREELLPVIYGRTGFKGVSTLLRWTGSNRLTGSALSHVGTRDLIVYRNVVLPWDGSDPLV